MTRGCDRVAQAYAKLFAQCIVSKSDHDTSSIG
jgi:hypothetical protein